MSGELGVLLLGYGLAGRVFHCPLIAATPGLALRGIVTGNEGRAAQAAADFPGVPVLASFDEAADLDGIDLVVIGTANETHVPLALAAIDRGLHVVIDKPIAPTAGRARAIASAAEEMGVQVHPFQNRRWDADFLTVRAIVDSGEIGAVHRFESRFARMRPVLSGSWRESAEPEQMGGVLYDFGAHLVDQAIALLGPVTEVEAHARSIRHADAADDDTVIVLTHASGAVSLLFGSMISAFADPRLAVFGTTGGIRISGGDTQEDRLRAGERPIDDTWGTETATAEVVLAHGNELERQERPLLRGRWDTYYPAVRDAIRGEGPVPVPLEDVIANLRVIEAAMASALGGTAVSLDPPAAHVSR